MTLPKWPLDFEWWRIRRALRGGDRDRAKRTAKDYTKDHPEDPNAWDILATRLLTDGEFEEAQGVSRRLRVY